MESRFYSYDLYNTETEEVETTEQLTAADVASRNHILRSGDEPQRWIATPFVNVGLNLSCYRG